MPSFKAETNDHSIHEKSSNGADERTTKATTVSSRTAKNTSLQAVEAVVETCPDNSGVFSPSHSDETPGIASSLGKGDAS